MKTIRNWWIKISREEDTFTDELMITSSFLWEVFENFEGGFGLGPNRCLLMVEGETSEPLQV